MSKISINLVSISVLIYTFHSLLTSKTVTGILFHDDNYHQLQLQHNAKTFIK